MAVKWRKIKISEICDLRMGETLIKKDLTNDGVPIYSADNSEEPWGFTKKAKLVLKKGNLVLGARGTIGSVKLPEYENFSATQTTIIISVHKDVLSKYLFFILKNFNFKRITEGIGIPMLTIKTLNKVELKFPVNQNGAPDLDEQKRIVKILEEAENLKNKRVEADKKMKDLIPSLFVEMFGDPALNLKKWKSTDLGSICTSIKDGPHLSPKYTNSGVPFLTVNNIIGGKWDLSKVRYVSREDHEIFQKKCKVEKGDILYTKGGTTGFAKYVDLDMDFSIWVHVALLKFNREEVNGVFLEKMLNSKFCYVQSQLLTGGIANRDLVLGKMKKIKLYLPPIKLQNEFAEKVKIIEKQREGQRKSEEIINILYGSLMQKVFAD